MPPARAASFFPRAKFKGDEAINSLFNNVELNRVLALLVESDSSPKLDLSIEGMRSQQFSVGVFFFMLLSIFVFSAIVYSVVFGKYAPKTMRTGEKIMFGGIIVGIVVAIIFGATQMLSGYLF